MSTNSEPAWSPTAEQIAAANLTAFINDARDVAGERFSDFESLYRWSIESPEAFWSLIWRFCGVVADVRADGTQWDSVLVGRDRMAPPDDALGPKWFTGAKLNFAENLLRFDDDREALAT